MSNTFNYFRRTRHIVSWQPAIKLVVYKVELIYSDHINDTSDLQKYFSVEELPVLGAQTTIFDGYYGETTRNSDNYSEESIGMLYKPANMGQHAEHQILVWDDGIGEIPNQSSTCYDTHAYVVVPSSFYDNKISSLINEAMQVVSNLHNGKLEVEKIKRGEA